MSRNGKRPRLDQSQDKADKEFGRNLSRSMRHRLGLEVREGSGRSHPQWDLETARDLSHLIITNEDELSRMLLPTDMDQMEAQRRWQCAQPRVALPQQVINEILKKPEAVGEYWTQNERLHIATAIQPGEDYVTRYHKGMVKVINTTSEWRQASKDFVKFAREDRVVTLDMEKQMQAQGSTEDGKIVIVLLGTLRMRGWCINIQNMRLEKNRKLSQIASFLGLEALSVMMDPSIVVIGSEVHEDLCLLGLRAMNIVDTQTLVPWLINRQGSTPRVCPDSASGQRGLRVASVLEQGWHLKPIVYPSYQPRASQAKRDRWLRDLKSDRKWKDYGMSWPYADAVPNHRSMQEMYCWPLKLANNTPQFLYMVSDICTPLMIARRYVAWELMVSDSLYLMDEKAWSFAALVTAPHPLAAPVLELWNAEDDEQGLQPHLDVQMPFQDPLGHPITLESLFQREQDPGKKYLLQTLLVMVEDYPPLRLVAHAVVQNFEPHRVPAKVPGEEEVLTSLEAFTSWGRRARRFAPPPDYLGGAPQEASLRCDQHLAENQGYAKYLTTSVLLVAHPRAKVANRCDRWRRFKQETEPNPTFFWVCSYCGQQHVGADCPLQNAAMHQELLQGRSGISCAYPLCLERTKHLTLVCPALSHLCQICHRRGHTATVCPGNKMRKVVAFECLRHIFERYADLNHNTSRRHLSPMNRDKVLRHLHSGRPCRINLAMGHFRIPLNLARAKIPYGSLRCLPALEAESRILAETDGNPVYDRDEFEARYRKSDSAKRVTRMQAVGDWGKTDDDLLVLQLMR